DDFLRPLLARRPARRRVHARPTLRIGDPLRPLRERRAGARDGRQRVERAVDLLLELLDLVREQLEADAALAVVERDRLADQRARVGAFADRRGHALAVERAGLLRRGLRLDLERAESAFGEVLQAAERRLRS